MAVAHHLKPGLTDKTRVKIMTVDIPNRHIEAVLKDGSMIHIPVWETPNAFRWPVEGEVWIVRRDHGMWTLDRRQQQVKDETQNPITAHAPGDMRLDAVNIFDAQGNRLATVSSAVGRPQLSFRGDLTIQVLRTGARLTSVTL